MDEVQNLQNISPTSGFSFSISWLFAGFVFGVIGFSLIRQAKSKGNLYWAVIGLALLGYTYFVSDPLWCWVIGGILCSLAYATRYM